MKSKYHAALVIVWLVYAVLGNRRADEIETRVLSSPVVANCGLFVLNWIACNDKDFEVSAIDVQSNNSLDLSGQASGHVARCFGYDRTQSADLATKLARRRIRTLDI